MVDNHSYNLMMQLVSESKSLKRIGSVYQADAGDCDDCKTFWDKMKADKEEHVQELQALIKKHI